MEQLDHMPPMSEHTDEEQQFSSRWFAILTSYLKGKCLHLLRSGLEQRDGFNHVERAAQRILSKHASTKLLLKRWQRTQPLPRTRQCWKMRKKCVEL